MKYIILIILLLIAGFLLYKWREPDLDRYNKYMCANYGYYEDCKTPLREEDKLK